MAIRTVSLEDQTLPPQRHELADANATPAHPVRDRCQHEARSLHGIIRQCRNNAVTVRNGTRLCQRHAYPPD